MTPSVYQNISVQFDSQGADESSQKPQKRGPGRPRLPEGPKDARGWRHRFRKDLLEKQEGCCGDCRQKRELTLHRINKNNDAPTIADYVLLCRNCIRERSGQPRTGAGQRHRIKKALQEKLGRKYQGFYMCPGCLKRKKLTLYRVNKGNNPPKTSDYLLLCDDCIHKKIQENKKVKLWSRKSGPRGGSPANSKTAFFNSIRALVFERDGRACVWCESKENLGLGPFIPPSRGGKLCFDNYVVTCQKCRGAKAGKLPLEYIWGEVSFKYWLSEELYHEPTATPGIIARVNLHLVAEISQFLMRIATNEDIEGKIRNKAERLNIKLSETDEDRGKERKAEVGSWIA